MTSGFVGLIGRWYRKRIAAPTPEQSGELVFIGANRLERAPLASGVAAGARQYWDQPEIFEGMVGFMNLCKIARAADNLENLLQECAVDNEDDPGIEIKGDVDSAALAGGALKELADALKPYRNARELCQGAKR